MNFQGLTRAAWPSVLVVVTGMYVYWAAHNNLVSSRPSTPSQYTVPDPVEHPGIHMFHSRLWQDPILTAHEYRKIHTAANDAAQKTQLTTITDPTPLDKLSMLGYWWAALSHSQSSDDGDVNAKQTLRSLVEEYDGSTLCLPVFLPGGPYAEDIERRIRTRFAVVTALAEAGYSLRFSQHQSYVVATIYVRVLNGWKQLEIVVPIKLYRPTDTAEWQSAKTDESPETTIHKPRQVFVLWINEGQLGQRPLLALHRILHACFSEVRPEEADSLTPIQIAIVGPASSDTLGLMRSELKDLEEKPGKHLEHWWAENYDPLTIQRGFAPLDPRRLVKKPVSIFSPRATAQEDKDFPERFFKLYRAIGTDDQLARELSSELKLRGVINDTIVLITEHDTLYGQEFPSTFEKTLLRAAKTESYSGRQKRKARPGESKVAVPQEDEPSPSNLITMRMLRGVDGRLVGPEADEGSPEPRRKSDLQNLSFESTAVSERRPEGRSQYDYLRRLPEQVKARIEINGSRPVRAIGVVGTDVYDKLLVMRVLRPHFPDCVFFTTDMDAIFTHSDELPHTRNLIIASHFGLSLGDTLQPNTLPFRDSYQTSTFLATRLAIHHQAGLFWANNRRSKDSHKLMADWFNRQKTGVPVQALRYVIGRNRARRLTPLAKTDSTNNLQPNDPSKLEAKLHPAARTSENWNLLSIAVVTLAGICGALLLSYRRELPLAAFFGDGEDPGNGRRGNGGERTPPPGGWPFSAVGTGFLALLGLGVALVVLVGIVGGSGMDVASLVGAYSTWTRNLLYALAGMMAVLCLAFLYARFRAELDEQATSSSKVYMFGKDHFQLTHVYKAVVLAVVLIYVSVLFAYGVVSPPAIAMAVVAAVVLFVGLTHYCDHDGGVWTKLRKKGTNWRANLILDTAHPESTILWGIIVVVTAAAAMALAEGLFNGPAYGWRPVMLSRGTFPRFVDWFALAYAFGMIGLLFSVLLYLQFWYREMYRAKEEGWFDPVDPTNMHERLRLIGKLSAVSGSLMPFLMALLLILVLAYHPLISPTPMPTGILAITSLGMLVFVGSTLMLRWHFHLQRDLAVSKLTARIERCPPAEQPSGKETTDDGLGGTQGTDKTGKRHGKKGKKHKKFKSTSQQSTATAVASKQEAKPPTSQAPIRTRLEARKKQIEALSDGVFQSWNQSPASWLLGGGTLLALADLWIRGLLLSP